MQVSREPCSAAGAGNSPHTFRLCRDARFREFVPLLRHGSNVPSRRHDAKTRKKRPYTSLRTRSGSTADGLPISLAVLMTPYGHVVLKRSPRERGETARTRGPPRVSNWNSRANAGKRLEARILQAKWLLLRPISSQSGRLPLALNPSRAASDSVPDHGFTRGLLPSTCEAARRLEAHGGAPLADPLAAHSASLIPLYRLFRF
jgi:hypothetical protein